MNRKKSHELFSQALKLMPGGVNSPARAFGAVGGEPIVIDRAEIMKALVVDDSAVMRKVVIGALSRAEIIDVDQAADGKEAVEACKENEPRRTANRPRKPALLGASV